MVTGFQRFKPSYPNFKTLGLRTGDFQLVLFNIAPSFNSSTLNISGSIVDIEAKKIYKAEIEIGNGLIQSIKQKENVADQFLLPGFIDAHVHIESSMLVPSEFARM